MLQLLIKAQEIEAPVETLINTMYEADQLIYDAFRKSTVDLVMVLDTETAKVMYFDNQKRIRELSNCVIVSAVHEA